MMSGFFIFPNGPEWNFLTSRLSVVTPPASNALRSAAFFELRGGGDKREKLIDTYCIRGTRSEVSGILLAR